MSAVQVSDSGLRTTPSNYFLAVSRHSIEAPRPKLPLRTWVSPARSARGTFIRRILNSRLHARSLRLKGGKSNATAPRGSSHGPSCPGDGKTIYIANQSQLRHTLPSSRGSPHVRPSLPLPISFPPIFLHRKMKTRPQGHGHISFSSFLNPL
ncbi:hypothetical protein VUR80DRAFT_8479 [Thermomyces stellatus]